MNSNMTRWIFASTSKHFYDLINSLLPLSIEGLEKLTNERDYCEFRLNGPDYKEIARKQYHIDININLLIVSIQDLVDLHKIQKNIGYGLLGFTECIKIYKYGDGSEDDQSLIGYFNLQTDRNNKIEIMNFGKIDPNTKLIHSTIDANYRMYYMEE